MCGITAILPQTASDPGALEAQARRMTEPLRHRGPDGFGYWVDPDGRCGLGHARLKVIDLETGDQPMSDVGERCQVVFNGEIYNFRELRKELEAKGHAFRTRSDTEVLVAGYLEWGVELPGHLEGMFAFALWDVRGSRLVVARDRAGQKPVFWGSLGGQWVISSELKSLLAHPAAPTAPDMGWLSTYLAFGYVPTPHTWFDGIESLPPGHVAVFTAEAPPTVEEYWNWDLRAGDRRFVDAPEAVEAVRSSLEESVRRRLVSDVPLGAFLSGGIDSSAVVGLMAREMNRPVKTFSIGFEGAPGYDETHHAAQVAARFGTDHTTHVVSAGSVSLLEELVTAHDGPFGDSSAIPTTILSGLVRSEVTVALSGDGADEAFGGYSRLYASVVAGRLPNWAMAAGRRLTAGVSGAADFRSTSRRAQQFFSGAEGPTGRRLVAWLGGFSPILDQIVSPDMLEAGSSRLEGCLTVAHDRSLAHSDSALGEAMAWTFTTYLPDDLLVKADRSSMARSLELRAPFLDSHVLETAARIPDGMRRRKGEKKWVLREAVRDLVPAEVMDRPKMGFGVPLAAWLRTSWKPMVEDLLTTADARVRRFLRPEALDGLVEGHLSGREDHSHRLWYLLTLEAWLRRFNA
jgi:asparagine synthase (glutamine-hydrolysing)